MALVAALASAAHGAPAPPPADGALINGVQSIQGNGCDLRHTTMILGTPAAFGATFDRFVVRDDGPSATRSRVCEIRLDVGNGGRFGQQVTFNNLLRGRATVPAGASAVVTVQAGLAGVKPSQTSLSLRPGPDRSWRTTVVTRHRIPAGADRVYVLRLTTTVRGAKATLSVRQIDTTGGPTPTTRASRAPLPA
ncbi:hypothetical protein GCM10010201_08340 [Pilimelia columellifera subsp. columellifera]|uniref:Uncharacterized protein n=2 Tax=Pilimelia TaxID=53370 RepID=A0ABN3N5L3_9ACTN